MEIEPPRVRIVSQGESIVLKCSVEGKCSSLGVVPSSVCSVSLITNRDRRLRIALTAASDPQTRVLWWRAENLTDAQMVGSSEFLHLHYIDVCDRGIYYCTDEFSNYDYAHSVNTLVVLQHSPLGSVSLLP